MFPQPPALKTLSRQASWLNRAGRVDRSACCELRASEVWPHASMKSALTTGKRGSRRANARVWREAAGECAVSAAYLAGLHDRRSPRTLIGDWRSGKSNAMRAGEKRRHALPGAPNRRQVSLDAAAPPPFQGGGRGVGEDQRRRCTSPSPCEAAGEDAAARDVGSNPNKGACWTKKLGLWIDWSQTVRVERWRLHPRLAQHFLICPSCGKKFGKLFMPLCTVPEGHDADLAEGWVRMIDRVHDETRLPIPLSLIAHRSLFIDRYGVLFQGRRLLCVRCLGVRYGEVKLQRLVRIQHEFDAPIRVRAARERQRHRREEAQFERARQQRREQRRNGRKPLASSPWR